MLIEEFLSQLKLDQYIDVLKINGINKLNDITEESLVLCIDKIGHRKRILTELKRFDPTALISMPVENIVAADHQEPPALPPKRSSSQGVPSPDPQPNPPRRSMSTKPNKPPRTTSIAHRGSLPAGAQINSENYHMLAPLPPPSRIDTPFPPIPPRTDRGETNNNDSEAPIIPNRIVSLPPERTDSPTSPVTGILVAFELPPPPLTPAPPIPVPRVPKPTECSQAPSIVVVTQEDTAGNLHSKYLHKPMFDFSIKYLQQFE